MQLKYTHVIDNTTFESLISRDIILEKAPISAFEVGSAFLTNTSCLSRSRSLPGWLESGITRPYLCPECHHRPYRDLHPLHREHHLHRHQYRGSRGFRHCHRRYQLQNKVRRSKVLLFAFSACGGLRTGTSRWCGYLGKGWIVRDTTTRRLPHFATGPRKSPRAKRQVRSVLGSQTHCHWLAVNTRCPKPARESRLSKLVIYYQCVCCLT